MVEAAAPEDSPTALAVIQRYLATPVLREVLVTQEMPEQLEQVEH
jgi:hypothetical protein